MPVTDSAFSYDNLIAGDFPRVTVEVTVLTGNNLARGTVLGKITSSGKVVAVVSDGTDDGRRAPYAVLADDVDATSADAVGTAYLTGEFNEDKLVYGGTDTNATHKDAMRALSLFQKSPVSAS